MCWIPVGLGPPTLPLYGPFPLTRDVRRPLNEIPGRYLMSLARRVPSTDGEAAD